MLYKIHFHRMWMFNMIYTGILLIVADSRVKLSLSQRYFHMVKIQFELHWREKFQLLIHCQQLAEMTEMELPS